MRTGVLLYDVGTGGAGRHLGMPIRSVRGMAFSPDGRLLAASSDLHHEILLWDLAARPERAAAGSRIARDQPGVRPRWPAPGLGGIGDRAILLWDLATGRPRRRLGVPPGPCF